ncbi:MAG: MIO-dependent tyrosine 2,3-aminomutase [Microgenomates bacterium OLB23]|nr:MAG: MIO-dependent tyrosine 2,3-aminomutase [Microgenomates bacterium OLB23]
MSKKVTKVSLNGSSLSLHEILSVGRNGGLVEFTTESNILENIHNTYKVMIVDVQNGVPIYGCNTGYGAQASHVVNKGLKKKRVAEAKKISEGITHIDVAVGPEFKDEIVRAAMLIRINMLMNGVSAVKLDDLNIYRKMLNAHITPVVNMYGGIGASGDLAHNARVLNAARRYKGTKVRDKQGNVIEAEKALKAARIEQLYLDPKAGLGLVNGDNFSTAVATFLAADTVRALVLMHAVAAMVIEVLRGTDRSFHPMLAYVRPHQGQDETASIMRDLLQGSKLAYQEMKGHKKRPKGVKVQDGYSLRGISQYLGVDVEKIKGILDTIEVNANAVSDNPLWVLPAFATKGEKPYQWVSGANFIAMHMVDVMDDLRKIMTHMTKLCDRHVARLVNTHESNGLPPNLSDKAAITQCAFKGVQIQSGMFDVYASLLSMPVSTFFGVHEEGNQDITSHALTSGILGFDNLRITHYALAQTLLAVCQAVDLRGGARMLSEKNKTPIYLCAFSGTIC